MGTTTDQCPGRTRQEPCRPVHLGQNYLGVVWRCELHSLAFVTGPDGKWVARPEEQSNDAS